MIWYLLQVFNSQEREVWCFITTTPEGLRGVCWQWAEVLSWTDTVLDQSGLLDKQAPVLRLWNKAPFSLGDGSDRPEREKSPSSTWQRAGTRSQQNQIEEVRESAGKSYLSGQACAQNSSCFCLLSSTNLGAKCIRDIRCPSSNLPDKRIRWAESCFACAGFLSL